MVIVIFCKAQSTLSPKCGHYHLISFILFHFLHRKIYILKKIAILLTFYKAFSQHVKDTNPRFFIMWKKDSTFTSHHLMAGEESDESKISEVLRWDYVFLFKYLTVHKREFLLDYMVFNSISHSARIKLS